MSRRNRIIVKKVRNIVILLMAIIVMIGAYKNIRDSHAEDVIEINAIAIDNYGYLSNELFKLEAIQTGEDIYELELPESVNGKEINQIVKVTLEKPVLEVETESGVQENALTENTDEPEPVKTEEQIPETTTPVEDNTTTEEKVPETTIPQEDTTQPPTETTPETTEEQTPTEPAEENTLEIIDNKITLTKEQIESKQLNIEVVYNVAIIETTEQGQISKNVLTEKTEEERQEIEITEETEMLYSKILKYEDEENQKLVEVKGFLPKDAELKVEEVSQEQLTEIFGDGRIDVAYDIKIVIHVTKEVLIDEADPTKGTTEIIETIEVNPEEFGESCEVSIKDIKIKEESQVYHVREDNTYEQVDVKENTEESITFDAQTFSIYAVTTDEDVMLSASVASLTFSPSTATTYTGKMSVSVTCNNTNTAGYITGYTWSYSTATPSSWTSITAGGASVTISGTFLGTRYLHVKTEQGLTGYSGPYISSEADETPPTYSISPKSDYNWSKTKTVTVTVSDPESGVQFASAYFDWHATPTNGGTKLAEYSSDDRTIHRYTSTAAREGIYYLGYSLDMGNNYGIDVCPSGYSGPYYIDNVAPTVSSVSKSTTAWTNGDVTLTVTGDKLNGSEVTQYSFDGGTTWQDSNQKTYTVNTSNISIMVKDAAGNISSAVTENITNIDKTAPTTPTITAKLADGSAYTGGTWTNQSVTLTAASTDGGSGVSYYQYSTDGTTWNNMTSGAVTFTESMNSTVYVRAVDGVGNVSGNQSIVVKIDKIFPTATITTSANLVNGKYYTNQPSITLYASDMADTGGSGFKTVSALNGWYGTTWKATHTVGTVNYDSTNNRYYATFNFSDIKDTATGIKNNGEGYYTFDSHIHDNAGNGGPYGAKNVIYDTTAPTYTGVEVKNVSNTGYDVYIYGVSDNLSGINRIQVPTWTWANGQDDLYWANGEAWSTGSAYSATNLGDGTWYYRVNTSDHNYEEGYYRTHVYIYDNAGNRIGLAAGYDDPANGDTYIDRTPPEINISGDNGIVTSGLVRYYDATNNTGNGHDSSATTWKDLSGNYDIDTITDASAVWGDNYLSIDENGDHDTDKVTIGMLDETLTSATFEIDFVADARLYYGSISQITLLGGGSWDVGSDGGWSITCNTADGRLQFNAMPLGSSENVSWRYFNNYVFSAGTRYRVTVTVLYENGNTTLKAYVNGKYIGQGSFAGQLLISNGIAPAEMGRADIYSLRIYNRPLTQNEIYQNLIASGVDVLDTGLIRHYNATNNTGSGHNSSVTTWKDLSGHYDATVNGGTFSNNYLSLDGTDDWVNAGQISLTNAVTVETTVEFDSVVAGARVLSNAENGGVSLEFVSDGRIAFVVYITGVGYKSVVSPETLEVGKKYHIIGSWDGSALRLYVNGVRKASALITGTMGATTNNTVLALGTNPTGSSPGGGYSNAKYYDVKVYDRAITEYEVYKSAYDAGLAEDTTDDGLIRHYNAVNNTGNGHSSSATTWKDLSGNYDATINGGATFSDNYLYFDGIDDGVNAGNLGDLNYVTLNVKFSLNGSYPDGVLANDVLTTGTAYLGILIDEEGYPVFQYKLEGSSSYERLTSTELLEYNRVYDITGTFDGTQVKLFVDGVCVGVKSVSGTLDLSAMTYFSVGVFPHPNGSLDYKGNYSIYSVKVWDRALASDEIYKNAQTDNEQTWKKSHSVQVTLTDDYIGLASGANIKYGWSTSTTTAPTSYTPVTLSYTEGTLNTSFTATGSGLTGKYYLWVVPETYSDLHQNSQTAIKISTNTYWFDNTLPTITFNPKKNETWAKSQSVTVNIGDSHSGLAEGAEVQYQWVAQNADGTMATPSSDGWITKTISSYNVGTNSVSFAVTNSTLTGKYYLCVKVVSLKDNTSGGVNELSSGTIIKSEGTFWLDNTLPYVGVTASGNETWKKSHTATVTIGDAHSGLAEGLSVQYGWSLNNIAEPSSWTTAGITSYSAGAATATFTATGSGLTGKYYLWVKPSTLKDVVGNAITETVKLSDKAFYFDNTKPMIEIDPTEEGEELGIVTDGLIRHYNAVNNTGSGHGSSTTTWKDLSGNYDATINGGATFSDKYLSFDGTDDYVNAGHVNLSNAATYEATIELSSLSEGNKYIISQFNGGGMTLGVNGGKAEIRAQGSGLNFIQFSDSEVLEPGKKYHIVGTFDGSTFKLYVNGELRTQYAASGAPSMAVSSHPLTIGGYLNTSLNLTDECFNGKIYDAKVYNRALTEAEIQQNLEETNSSDTEEETPEEIPEETIDNTWSKTKDVTVKIYDKHSGLEENAKFKYGWSTSNTVEPTKWNEITVSNYEAGAESTTFVVTASPETIGETEPADKYYLWVEPVDFRDISVEDGNAQTNGKKSEDVYWIDHRKPTITFNPQQNETWSRSHSVEVIINDAHSGLAEGTQLQYQWVLKNEDGTVGTPTADGWQTVTGIPEYTEGTNDNISFTTTQEGLTGEYYLCIKPQSLKDISYEDGNQYPTDDVISSEGTFWFDNEAPVVTLGSQGNPTWLPSHTAPVTISDAHSGLAEGTQIKYGWSTSTETEPIEWIDAEITSYSAGAATAQFDAVTPATLEPGKYYLWVKPVIVEDILGNEQTEIVISQETFWLDNKPSTITIEPQEREVWAKTHSATVKVEDIPSGLAEGVELEYQWVKLDEDTGDLIENGWQTLEIPEYTPGDTALEDITITTSDLRGKYYLWVKPVVLKDIAGNEQTEIAKTTGTFWFDYIPPQITITPEENTTWQQTHTTQVGIFDEHCGLELGAVVKYGWSTSNTVEPTSWTEIDLAEDGTPSNYERETNDVITFTAEMDTQLETGEYYLWVVPIELQDIVGNIAETKISEGTFNVDYTAPTITLDQNSNETYKQIHTVEVSLSDEHSGLETGNKIKYGWSTSNTTAPSNYTTVELTGYERVTNDAVTFTATTEGLVSTTGNYYLWVVPYESGTDIKLLDVAGNSQTETKISTGTFYIDYDAPIWTTENFNKDTADKEVTVDIVGSDLLSGYASDTLDTGDITVKVDGELASSITKHLSTPTYYKANGTTTTDVNQAVEVKYTLTLSGFEQEKLLQDGKNYKEWSGAISINIAANTLTDKAGNTNATDDYALGQVDFVKPQIIYRYSEADINKTAKEVKIKFDVTDKYYSSGELALSDLTIYIDGENVTNNAEVTKTFATPPTPVTAIVNGSSKTIGHTYTLTLSELEETEKDSGENYLDYSGVVTVEVAANKITDTSNNTNDAKTITMGINLPEETGSGVIADVVNPIWEIQNVQKTADKKVTVDIIGTDKYYVSNSLDESDITVYVDGTPITSTTNVKKSLSTAEELKEDRDGDGTAETVYGVKYTLTLSDWEESTLQDGKIFREWSGTTQILIPAGTLTDGSANTNTDKTFTLGLVDFTKPVIEPVSVTNGATTQSIVFNVIDKYLKLSDPISTDEIIVSVDGVEISGISKVIKSKTNLTATVNGNTEHVVGQQYTLELEGFTQDDWTGTVSVVVKAEAVYDTSNNPNDVTTLYGKHIDEAKPTIEKVSSAKDPSTSTETIVVNVLDKYLDIDENDDGLEDDAILSSNEIKVYVDNVDATAHITKTITKVQNFTATVNGNPNHVIGQQYKIELSGFEKARSIAYNEYTDYSGTVRIEIIEGAVKDIVKDSSGGNENDLTPIDGDFVDFIEPDVNYIYSSSGINYDDKYFTMDFEITDKYFANSTLTNGNLTNYLTIYVDGEDITTNTKVTKEITSITDVKTTGAINKTVVDEATGESSVQSVTNALIGKRYTLKLSHLQQDENDGLNYSGVISVTLKANTATDTSSNGNLVDTTTIKTGSLPSGGTPEDGTVDVVDPIWVQAADPTVKPSLQTATITVKAKDKFYDSNSFDETDITVLVNGEETTDGITVNVDEDTSEGAEAGKQYKVTVTGFPQTAYSLKIVIDEGAITDKSGNLSQEQEFVLYTTLMATDTETEATSAFLNNPYGIQRQYVEQVIFMDSVGGTAETRWDVSAVQDKSIIAWYETRIVDGKTLYTVYIGSKVIMNANRDSSNLFKYVGYDSSCKVTGDTTDNPLIKNIELLRMDNVVDMSYMFYSAGYSNMKSLDLGSNFNTENVEYMNSMFSHLGHSAMTNLDLGEKFDTTKVTDMTAMFDACGYVAMTSLDLGDKFDTSSVTTMRQMFAECGYTAMTSLNLGSDFDTSIVNDMAGMFKKCGFTAMTSLDLGENFDTSGVTNMEEMFLECGNTAMTSLDLGAKFTKIANANTDFATSVGKSGECVIYAPSSIYKDMTHFRESKDSTTTLECTNSTINPIYKPEWEKVSSTLAADGTMTVVVKGSAIEEFNIGNTLTDPQNYLSDVTSESNAFTVYIDGEVASDVTASVVMGTPTLNESTGAKEITATITLKDFAKALRKEGKNFLEWTGNVSVQLAQGTLVDIYGNPNLAEIGINTSGGMDRVEIEDTLTDKETNGVMFIDDIKPEFTYKWSDTVINHGQENADEYVIVVFDITDKYFKDVEISADRITVALLDDEDSGINDNISKELTEVRDLTYTTGNGTELTIGKRYQLKISNLDKGDGSTYSGPMSLSFLPGAVDGSGNLTSGIIDKSGNLSDAKTITIGINEPEGDGNQEIVDVVDPIWSVENININHTNKNVTVDLVAYDKYYASNSLDTGDITVEIDGVTLTTTITDVNVKKSLSTETAETNGVRYTLTLSDWQEALRQSGKNYLEWSGTTKIKIAAGTITDQYTNTSNEQEFTLGHVDFIKPEIVEIEPTAELQAQDLANKTETIVFTVTDKYLNTTDMVTKDEILIYVDEEDVTSVLKDDAELTYEAIDGGYKYTLVIKNFEKARSIAYNEYTNYSGTVRIDVKAGAATDTNTPTANTNDLTPITGDFVDYIEPDVNYIYSASNINYGDKYFTMDFEITDKYFANSTLTNENLTNYLTIYVDGEDITTNTKVTKEITSITDVTTVGAINKTVVDEATGESSVQSVTNAVIGKRYTLKLSDLEQVKNDGFNYSGVVSVTLKANTATDTSSNGNLVDTTTIKTGNLPSGGTPEDGTVDVVDPVFTRVSSSANAIDQTATITFKGTDKFLNDNTLTLSDISVWVNGVKDTSIVPTLSEATVMSDTEVQYTVTVAGFATDVNQVKIQIVEDAITDDSNNGNKVTDLMLYNCLELTNEEDAATDGFLDGNGANLTGIARQDIEKVIFVSSIDGATASGVAKVWDVSAQNDGSIKAWTSQTAAPYTVYIGSDFEIFANQDSSYLFYMIGFSTACTATDTISGLNLLNTSSVTSMRTMFFWTGYRAMTALDLGDNFDTANVINTEYMFCYTGYMAMSSFDLGDKFDTSKVTTMASMFANCGYKAMPSLSLGDKFDTTNVRHMQNMFQNCGYTAMTSLDLSSGTAATNTTQFNTNSVQNMTEMFKDCGYTAMTNLKLGTNFNTSSVTDMSGMFENCGYTAMTSLDLSSGTAQTNTTQFNTIAVTDMQNMFAWCGYTAMTSLNLGNNFNTANVTGSMLGMFQECGYTAMTSLDLGDKFDTTNVTNMTEMFKECGYTSMKTLNLGPAFTKIASTNTGFLINAGKEGECTIYAPESIYSNKTVLKLDSTSTTTIKYINYIANDDDTYTETATTRGTIIPTYKPEWTKESSSITGETISINLSAKAKETQTIDANTKINYNSTITSNLSTDDIEVYINGELDGDLNKNGVLDVGETPSITKTLTSAVYYKEDGTTETTNPEEYFNVAHTLTLSNFEQTARQTGKPFKEWSGNISIKILGRGEATSTYTANTIVDSYGNQSMMETDEGQADGTWIDVIYKDADSATNVNTSGVMFTDFIKPEFTYEYSTTSTIIDHGTEMVTVVFDVTDKYFDSIVTSNFIGSNIDIIVDETQIPSTVVIEKTLTKVKEIYYDTTAGTNYVEPDATGIGTKVGEQYKLEITGLDQGEGFTYSGPMTLSFKAGMVQDKSGNTNNAKSITLGVNEPDQTGSEIIVDVVDPVWSVEGTPQITHVDGVTTATMTLIAKDKYYNGNTIISAENTNKVQVIVDGVDISVDANNDGISDIAPGLVKTLEKLEDIKETRNGTEVTIGEKYKFTLTGLEETDELFFNKRELYETSNGTSGRVYREYVGNVSIVMPANTIIDQYGNGNNEYPVSLGYIDVVKPEVIKVSSRNIIDETNIENSKQEIVFDIVDKYLSTSAITEADTSKIHVLVDGDEVTDIKKTITDIIEFKAMVSGSERTVGYRYTLELSEFEAARTATYGTYTNWSGDISILVDEGTATDTKGSENDETELDVGYADFIKPDVTYIYATDDIDKTDKEFTMVFEITDKYFNASTLEASDLTILVDGESTIIDTDNDGTPDTDRITRSLTSTDITYGKRYTLTLSGLEQLQIQDGDKYLDFSGVITVAIPQGVATDTNTPTANGNELTTITSGINIPGGTGTGTIVDVVDPLIERVSSSANAINQTATIKIRGTDKYLNDSTLTDSDILVWINGQLDGDTDGDGILEEGETPTLPKTLGTATPLNETRLVNGVETTKQYGVEYTITVSGFAKDVNQVKIQIVKGALTDDSGNGNKLTDLWLYNCLELTDSEDLKTDGFLDGNGTNSTGIERQNIQQVIFTDSLAGSTASGVAKVWDVSAQNDGSIKAWTSQTSAPYTVYIGSDFEIFANQNSTYLFGNIGRGESCTATEAIKNINLLNTSSVTNMSYMFAGCGYKAMTGLNLGTKFYTSNVTDMHGMFIECGYTAMVTLKLGNNFDTSKVANMEGMFNSCGYTAMTGLDLSSGTDTTNTTQFNTGNVTTMTNMFNACGYTAMTTLNLGTNFDTRKVTNMQDMFGNCGYTAMTGLDLSSGTDQTNTTQFNTSAVTNMIGMFRSCGRTAMDTLNLGTNFDTSNVNYIWGMFWDCGFTAMTSLDLGDKFDTSGVVGENMQLMFAYCGYTAMTSLDLGDEFDTSQVTGMNSMFAGCGYTAMTSLDLGNKFDTTSVTNMTDMFKDCGYTSMTTLDLGPAFTNIPASASTDMFTNCGTSSLVIYAPEEIYANRTTFK